MDLVWCNGILRVKPWTSITYNVITLAGLLKHHYVTLIESSLQMLANIEKVVQRGGLSELNDERSAYIGSSPTPPPSLQVETANVN